MLGQPVGGDHPALRASFRFLLGGFDLVFCPLKGMHGTWSVLGEALAVYQVEIEDFFTQSRGEIVPVPPQRGVYTSNFGAFPLFVGSSRGQLAPHGGEKNRFLRWERRLRGVLDLPNQVSFLGKP